MPRLRNRLTGVVVNVDEATAKQLGPQYVPADEPEKRKPGRPRKSE